MNPTISIDRVDAGNYWTDGGAMLGVLPRAIWGKKVQTDERHRKKLALNLLLIKTEDRKILVDTGLGNRLNEKQRDIYRPSEFMLPASLAELGIRDRDITDVVLTHLHFDHAGGIVTGLGATDRLTFPKARHWIQKTEWETAKNPDGLNRAAYSFEWQLALLEHQGKQQLIDGNVEIAPGVTLVKTGGHTVGSQIVEIDGPQGFYIYAADIIPTLFHSSAAITSAYDVCREDTFKAKQYIFSRLKEKNGSLLLNHDLERWELSAAGLKL
ncbi:MAG: MBL fold metallo-hydrolase [Candidatus Cloacimonetes bacterium]|nr:MBL fold metallo-hydrolase [Candidatus Cloacimonadota bacterium]